MVPQILVQNDQYNGQYVAFKSSKDLTIVGHGKSPTEALKMAERKGFSHPVLLYVEEKDLVQIYPCW